ncbi:MAG TPA: hypothetical protein VFV86_10825 [Nitrososphaeraceae archaeon]|nr:hypothetical protein [Nitrososphaeraceae archaeon]
MVSKRDINQLGVGPANHPTNSCGVYIMAMIHLLVKTTHLDTVLII